MKLRRLLLLAFLLVGVTPTALLAMLAFERTRGVVQQEIEEGLTAQAQALAAEINQLIYERLQNAASWQRTEPMQDLKVGDVDRRLSSFLQGLAAGYGSLYIDIEATDLQGRTVASSNARRIGLLADQPRPWQAASLLGSAMTLDQPSSRHPQEPISVVLRTPISSAFGEGALGELRLRLDWSRIDRRLDEAALGGRMVALVDPSGVLVAGSQRLLAALPRLQPDLAPWAAGDARAMRQPVPGMGPMFVGLGRTEGVSGSSGLDWRVLVLVPRDEALAPVRSLAWIFALLLAGIGLLTVILAGAVSQTIARPIVALTQFSRHYRHGQALPVGPSRPRVQASEIGELQQAFVQMVKDINHSQAQLSRASALAAVGEMSAVIAHEVRTPLGVLLSSAQILQQEPSLSDEGRELASYIESESTRLGRLVSTMLESTRPRAPMLAATDIESLITHVVGLLGAQADKQGVRVVHRSASPLPPLRCDAEQMTQVLLNLVLNGLQILHRGGQIEISTRDTPEWLMIDIADDGPGVAPELRGRIFEAFYFQREGGLGLGLAVVQRIVAAHGGRIEVGDSKLGGALFSIWLPQAQREADSRDPFEATTETPGA